jgi:hypothetical protein
MQVIIIFRQPQNIPENTRGDPPFSYTASHKDTEVGTKNLKFALIRPKDRFPPVLCPLLMFLGPNKSLLLIGVL